MARTHRVSRLIAGGLLTGAFLVSGMATASAQPTCFNQEPTIVGTSDSETTPGTEGNDVITTLGGNDVVNGAEGNDRICGGAGNDVLVGGPGNDRLRGGGGNDVIVASDGVEGNDLALGGPGNDTCIVDAEDFTIGCENEVVIPTDTPTP
jgi:hypothetical protein